MQRCPEIDRQSGALHKQQQAKSDRDDQKAQETPTSVDLHPKQGFIHVGALLTSRPDTCRRPSGLWSASVAIGPHKELQSALKLGVTWMLLGNLASLLHNRPCGASYGFLWKALEAHIILRYSVVEVLVWNDAGAMRAQEFHAVLLIGSHGARHVWKLILPTCP